MLCFGCTGCMFLLRGSERQRWYIRDDVRVEDFDTDHLNSGKKRPDQSRGRKYASGNNNETLRQRTRGRKYAPSKSE